VLVEGAEVARRAFRALRRPAEPGFLSGKALFDDEEDLLIIVAHTNVMAALRGDRSQDFLLFEAVGSCSSRPSKMSIRLARRTARTQRVQLRHSLPRMRGNFLNDAERVRLKGIGKPLASNARSGALRASVGSTDAPLEEVTVDGDHRSDGCFLDASAPLQAEGAHLN
jgi:hypothetical protein